MSPLLNHRIKQNQRINKTFLAELGIDITMNPSYVGQNGHTYYVT